jgi:hypothetical protein
VPTATVDVEPLDWSTEFLPWFADVWQPGEHVGIIAPTGAGKSTFAKGILDSRTYVLVPDAKGGDSTLDGYGFPRLSKWAGKDAMGRTVADNDEHGRPSRYVIGNAARTAREIDTLRDTIARMLTDAHEMGGWTVYLDELQIVTDPRHFGLRASVDKMLIAARDRGISVVSSFQAPRWVTPTASQQATWVAVSRTRDTDIVNRLAEILGRPKAEIRGALKGLEKFSWVVVGRDPYEPLRVTVPEYVAPKRREV